MPLVNQDDPVLRKKAEPVTQEEIGSEFLRSLSSTMIAIMARENAVGIAAPQIGVSKRMIAFSTAYTKTRKPEYDIPDTVLINPSYDVVSDEVQEGYEGCLNCGETMAKVPRAMEIQYHGTDMEGNPITKKATGLEARILQHEVDHLEGHLFLDRVEDEESITTRTELLKSR